MPFASANGIRLVLLNARDNGKSTLYSDSELEAVRSTDQAVQREFMCDSIRGFASFLAWYVGQESIPPIALAGGGSGHRIGGISLVAWSGGNSWFIPFFGMADTIPTSLRAVIDPYLKTYIIFGTIHICSSNG